VPAAALIQDPRCSAPPPTPPGPSPSPECRRPWAGSRATATAVLGGATVTGTADAPPVRRRQTAVGTIPRRSLRAGRHLVDPAAFRFLQQHTFGPVALPFRSRSSA
jgi:hypothetical protein